MFEQAVELLEKDTNYEIIFRKDDEIVFENDKKLRYITVKKISSTDTHIQLIVDSEEYYYDKTVNDLKIIERLKNI